MVRRLSLAEMFAWALLAAVLVYGFAAFLIHAWQSVMLAQTIDYAEGIVWQQALLMPGPRMYGDINTYPFIVFHYPPAYHLLVRLAGMLAGVADTNLLAVGRMVSTIATLVIAACVGTLVHAAGATRLPRRAAMANGTMAALLVLTVGPVVLWATVMRVDMVALAFTYLGLWFTALAGRRPALVHAAMLCFVLGVYSKQTTLAAPAAALALLAYSNPRQAVRALLSGLAMGLALLAPLMLATEGRFLRHILGYNINPFTLRAMVGVAARQAHHAGFALVAVLAVLLLGRDLLGLRATGGTAGLRRALNENMAVRIFALAALHLAFSLPLLATMGKSGAGFYYMNETFCACCVLAGLWSAKLLADVGTGPDMRSGPRSRMVVALPLLLAAQAVVAHPRLLPLAAPSAARLAHVAQMERLEAAVSATPGPVLSQDMVLLLRAGKEVPLEPAIMRDLARVGSWDETRFAELLRARYFDFLVTNNEQDDHYYTPSINRVIAETYPCIEDFGRYWLRRPPAACGKGL